MKGDFITVLDLGASKVVALAASADETGSLRIHGLASVDCRGLRRGVVTDLDETARSIEAAVRRLRQDLDAEIGEVVVGVSGPHVEGMNAQGFKPIVPRSRTIAHQDVLEVVNHSRSIIFPPDREQIQAIPREFRVDGERNIKKPIGMSGGKLEVITYLVTGQSTHIQNLERAVSMAGVKIGQMVLRPLASGIAVLTPDEVELGAVVIDIGAGSTDIGVFTQGSIAFSACLPVGSQAVTNDISTLLKATPDEGERLKVNHGHSMASLVSDSESVEVLQLGQTHPRPMQRRVLAEIIESRMREIATLSKQQIEKSGLMGTLPGGVILTGGGSQLPGTDRLFGDVMRHVRVRVAEPRLLGLPSERAGLAVAVGLAQFALQSYQELQPATGNSDWKERVRSLWSLLSGKA